MKYVHCKWHKKVISHWFASFKKFEFMPHTENFVLQAKWPTCALFYKWAFVQLLLYQNTPNGNKQL